MRNVYFFLFVILLFPLQENSSQEHNDIAVFAGGCFWCVEEAFDKVEGVNATISGFSGGHVENPSYNQVVSGGTGHIEVVQVQYDPRLVSYEQLLYVYWRNIDPFDAGGQFCDRGNVYSSAIFYLNNEQRVRAEHSRDEIEHMFDRTVVTEIRHFESFYPAEEYHQNYYQKNPIRYRFYRTVCGRYQRLDEIWGTEARGGDIYG